MKDQKSKFMVGLFMAGGMTLALVAVIWLGVSKFFETGRNYVTYFDESVQGLNIDSPVKYRGVAIGRVERIEVAPDSRLVKVVLKLERDMKVEDDMFVQLKVVGITGSMFLEMDRMNPEKPFAPTKLNFPSEYPIIAAKPSEMSRFFRGLDEVMQNIAALDMEGISLRAKDTLDTVKTSVEDLDTNALSKELKTSLHHLNQDLDSKRWAAILASLELSLKELRSVMGEVSTGLARFNGVVDRVDNLVAENSEDVAASMAKLREAMERSNSFLEGAGAMVAQANASVETISAQYLVLGQNLEDASHSLNRTMQQLSEDPSRLLFGQSPSARILKQAPPAAEGSPSMRQ